MHACTHIYVSISLVVVVLVVALIRVIVVVVLAAVLVVTVVVVSVPTVASLLVSVFAFGLDANHLYSSGNNNCRSNQ